MRVAAAIAVGVAMMIAVPVAGAAQRYAVPNGTGTACTQVEPCSLTDAVIDGGSGDEVILGAGEYTISAPLKVGQAGMHVHGDLGAPMPRLVAALGGQPAVNLLGDGIGISYVEVLNQAVEGVGIRCTESTRVERVRLTGQGEGAAGLVQVEDCLVRDSLLLGVGTNSLGMESLGTAPNDPAGTARNVTAIATGDNSVGIQSRYSYIDPGARILNLTNAIVAGGSSDLRTEDSVGTGRIVVSNSNFDVVKEETPGAITGVANQTAPPLFTGPADFLQAPGSPTIDAGSVEGIGALDLAGNPRLQGPAPDIGAHESAAVPVGTLTSLALSPKAFLPLKRGGAIASARRGKPKAPSGSRVRYELTAAAAVTFTVERALKGRRSGKRCVKQTAANRAKKACTRFKALKGSFTHPGNAGPNSFKFSGRIRNKALRPGKHRLVATVGASVKRTGFTIVR